MGKIFNSIYNPERGYCACLAIPTAEQPFYVEPKLVLDEATESAVYIFDLPSPDYRWALRIRIAPLPEIGTTVPAFENDNKLTVAMHKAVTVNLELFGRLVAIYDRFINALEVSPILSQHWKVLVENTEVARFYLTEEGKLTDGPFAVGFNLTPFGGPGICHFFSVDTPIGDVEDGIVRSVERLLPALAA